MQQKECGAGGVGGSDNTDYAVYTLYQKCTQMLQSGGVSGDMLGTCKDSSVSIY